VPSRPVHFPAVEVVYLDGQLVAAADARVSLFDHGLMTGDGVFETVLVRAGRPFALGRHLARLERSAAGMGLALPDRDELEHAVAAVAASVDELERARLRLMVTGGRAPLGSSRGGAKPSLFAAAAALPAHQPGPAAVAVAPWPRNEHGALTGLKTTSYAENVVALEWAAARGASEALFGNTAGLLCEGTGSNVFVVVDGTLLTPPLSAGPLAGVTRELVIELVDCVEKDVPLEMVRAGEVEEVFLTSTTRGVQAVVSVDGRGVGTAPEPGRRTAAAAAALEGLMAATDEP
jgi:branched-chain amino acid aminotransferase